VLVLFTDFILRPFHPTVAVLALECVVVW